MLLHMATHGGQSLDEERCTIQYGLKRRGLTEYVREHRAWYLTEAGYKAARKRQPK